MRKLLVLPATSSRRDTIAAQLARFEVRTLGRQEADAVVATGRPSLRSWVAALSDARAVALAQLITVHREGGLALGEQVELLAGFDDWLRSREDSSRCVLATEHGAHGASPSAAPSLALLFAPAGHPLLGAVLESLERATPGSTPDARFVECFRSVAQAGGADVELLAPEVISPLSRVATARRWADRRYISLMALHRAFPRVSVAVDHGALPAARPPAFEILERLGTAVAGRTTLDEVVRPQRYQVRFPERAFPPRANRRTAQEQRIGAGRSIAARSHVAVCAALYNRPDLALLLRLRVEALAPHFRRLTVHVLGDDSTDETRTVLRDWAAASPTQVRNVPVPALPREVFAKMAALRNALLESVEADGEPELLLMLDGDLEGPVSERGLLHALAVLDEESACAAVTAFGVNNRFGIDLVLPTFGYSYYDPLAFREHEFARVRSDAAIRLRLLGVNVGDPPFRVKSAFGGAALYRASALRGLRYPADPADCEHVAFHRVLHERGHHVVVDPSFLLLAGKQGHHEQAPK